MGRRLIEYTMKFYETNFRPGRINQDEVKLYFFSKLRRLIQRRPKFYKANRFKTKMKLLST